MVASIAPVPMGRPNNLPIHSLTISVKTSNYLMVESQNESHFSYPMAYRLGRERCPSFSRS